MEALLWSSLMLDYASIQLVAQRMASRPTLSRDTGELETLNKHLPDHFFFLQDKFERTAADLAQAAGNKDDRKTADKLGELTGTCVQCHSLYLRSSRPL